MMGELKMKGRHGLTHYYIQNPAIISEKRFIEESLEKAGLTEFAKQLNILASLWFGQGGEADTGTAFQLEEYIFSKGMEDRRLDSKIIPYEKTRVDFYQRDRDEEWGKKQRAWMFPHQGIYGAVFSRFYIKSHSYYGFAGEFEESESLGSLRKYGSKRNGGRFMRV